MLSWITGSKTVDSMKDLQDDGRVDDTQFEAPETPAPVFAVRAFKHAIFGTPQPPPTVASTRLSKSKKETNSLPAASLVASKESAPSAKDVDITNLGLSPTKRGILLTPGTVRGRKKEVAFGAQVVDNEGKKKTRSGIPNSCPGKFPSPWTPKVADVVEENKYESEEEKLQDDERKLRAKVKQSLCEAKATGTSSRKAKARAKDDADITIDMTEPRSESGRYWKEQYLSYSHKSEEETKKLIAKQKLARDYARKKDHEANELRRQIESDRKKRHTRENSLENQVKDLREQLRQALGENARMCTELAMLRKQAEATSISQTTEKGTPVDQAHITHAITASINDTGITPTDQLLEPLDSIWVDAAGADEEDSSQVFASFLPGSEVPTRSRGEPSRTRNHHRERRKHRRTSTINRQDYVAAAGGVTQKAETLKRTPTTRPGSTVSTPTRRTLGERDMNSYISSPTPALPSPSDLENLALSSARKSKKSGDVDKAPQEPFNFDSFAPNEALSMQAEQPITPQPPANEANQSQRKDVTPVPSSRKHRRSEVKVDLPNDRMAAARARLAARKRQKDNSRIS